MSRFIEVLQQAERDKASIAAATIVSIEGSAYRREGAKMLFAENGRNYGTLSAGCLESDLTHRAEAVLKDGTSQLLTYDMSSEDDFTWGRGTGCNGVIYVLLESINFANMNHSAQYWTEVLTRISNGESAVTCRELSTAGDSGRYLIVNADGAAGSWGHDNGDAVAAHLNWFSSSEKRSYAARITGNQVQDTDEPIYGNEGEDLPFYFFDKIQPRERLFILGGGPDAEPMVDILGQIGFDITVVDHRPVRLSKDLFPRAKVLLDARPTQANDRVHIPEGSCVIIMTHSFQDDKIWLDFLKGKSLRYLGILGPRRRTERLLPAGFETSVLHSPIGLNVHADGPEEIAVAVAAELIQVRRTGDPVTSAEPVDAPFADRSACQRPYLDKAH